jgi:hypothetical protein
VEVFALNRFAEKALKDWGEVLPSTAPQKRL